MLYLQVLKNADKVLFISALYKYKIQCYNRTEPAEEAQRTERQAQ